MENTTVALDILLGTEDQGATIDRSQYLGYYTYALNNGTNRGNNIHYEQFTQCLKKMRLQPSELAMDLLVVACAAYAR